MSEGGATGSGGFPRIGVFEECFGDLSPRAPAPQEAAETEEEVSGSPYQAPSCAMRTTRVRWARGTEVPEEPASPSAGSSGGAGGCPCLRHLRTPTQSGCHAKHTGGHARRTCATTTLPGLGGAKTPEP